MNVLSINRLQYVFLRQAISTVADFHHVLWHVFIIQRVIIFSAQYKQLYKIELVAIAFRRKNIVSLSEYCFLNGAIQP